MMHRLINFFGDEKYLKIRWRLLLLVLALVLLADFLVTRHPTAHFWDAIPGWGAFFGFISCAVIIFVSKFIGKKGGIMKDEDYYD
ncbi:MAG: hypothetical protein COB54_00760 [Alphaproteobacteria bacterium]|nr:MAG: hypothetical protein COB54_00760 [Alphaproteobacteria bacterium]